MSDLKRGYLPRYNTVRDEKGDLVTGYHSILASWRKHFFQLFIVHGISYIRQTEKHTAEPLVPEPSAFEFEMTIEKLKRLKSQGINQIYLIELIKARGRKIRSEIHKLINSIWDKKELPEEWKESIIVPIYKKGDKTVCSNFRALSLLSTTYKI